MDLMVLNVDNQKAENIARIFLSQNYSVLKIIKSNLANHAWTVEVLVSSFDKNTVKKIKIDDRTGTILKIE